MRGRLRYVPLALLALAVVEVVVFVFVGRAIGFGWTILIGLAASVLGMWLLRREGLRAWRGFRDAAQSGSPPGEQVTDGVVGLAAGLLLAAPGLVSGAVGLLLAVPPVRRLTRRRVQVAAERRVSSAVAGDLFGPRRVRVHRGEPAAEPAGPTLTKPEPGAAAAPEPAGPTEVIEGEIVEPGPRR
ncbi:FxsA family protein [Polymorphospora rubra]|uniref:Uncharacterized protein n=1 Tax=Polymorphospora rubra TaxID=338584 RepID=A0A810N665_9ACTN|nr:FxsA family protein [Polymorphospora rubra]BCJ69042.1 hypothetical protein Prubr_60630 [Polymorphospora rubra]